MFVEKMTGLSIHTFLFSWLVGFSLVALASPCSSVLSKIEAKFYDQFEPQISLTNEGRSWRNVRDRIITVAQAHPDRYVVSTGLQQSLELAFSGVPKVVMVDAYGPSIATFALFSDLAKRFESSEDFFRELKKHLKSGTGERGEAAKSYAIDSDTPESFINIFRKFGEAGYQRFREAALAGDLKFLHEDVSNPGWAERVRELTEERAPSSIYISNIMNWMNEMSDNSRFRQNLIELGFERANRPLWFGLTQREEINFGSYIAQMLLNGLSSLEFIPQFQRIDEAGIARHKERQSWRFSETYQLEPALRQSFPDEFENQMIRIRSRFNNEILDEGFLSRDESGVIRFYGGSSSDSGTFFNPDIHQLETMEGDNWPLYFQSRTGQTVHFYSKTSGKHYRIKIESVDLNQYHYRYDSTNEVISVIGIPEGESSPRQINFSPQRHVIIED